MFDYDLPQDRIAQHAAPRGESNLLVAKNFGSNLTIDKYKFKDIVEFFKAGDLLVLNSSRVKNWRFIFDYRGKDCELLLLRNLKDNLYRALAKPMKFFSEGDQIKILDDLFFKVVVKNQEFVVEIINNTGKDLDDLGITPIPPYIRKGRADNDDRSRYQNIYAEEGHSVAAPTAGLHFSKELLETLKINGVEILDLKLHVGPASFLNIQDVNSEDFKEYFEISKDTMQRIVNAKSSNRRVVAVGTTTTRCLESLGLARMIELISQTDLEIYKSSTNLFIAPGFEFTILNGLITNFHQPGTTHLSLVGAFIGEDEIKSIYSYALNNDFRFLSYGDSSFLLREY